MEPEVIFFDLNITVSFQEKDKTDEDKIEIIEIAVYNYLVNSETRREKRYGEWKNYVLTIYFRQIATSCIECNPSSVMPCQFLNTFPSDDFEWEWLKLWWKLIEVEQSDKLFISIVQDS